MVEKNNRVGCILSSDDKKVEFLGWGSYIGDTIPTKDAGGFGPILHEMGRANPTIRLDNGDLVYGCECWWGSVKRVKDIIKEKEVVEVSIHDYRNFENNRDE